MDAEINQNKLMSSVLHLSKRTTVESPKGITIKKYMAKYLLELIETYGKEGRAYVQKCRVSWIDVITVPIPKSATTLDDYVTQRVLNFGAGYVVTLSICGLIFIS